MKIISSDGVEFEFDGSQSNLLMNVQEDCGNQCPIPIPIISSEIIQVIQKWQECEEDPINEPWDVLWNLAHACIYLQMDEMLDRACRQMAHVLKGKSPTEIRQLVRIQ
jgi:hypothetical protein